jgi:hydroxyacylglutathione hydrolase
LFGEREKEITQVSNPGESPQIDQQLEVTVADVVATRDTIQQLIDVRELDEWQEGRIDGGTLIPMSEFAARVQEIDPAQPIIVYCRSGGRSLMVAEALQNAGYDAKSMAGGILEWERAGHPVER